MLPDQTDRKSAGNVHRSHCQISNKSCTVCNVHDSKSMHLLPSVHCTFFF